MLHAKLIPFKKRYSLMF